MTSWTKNGWLVRGVILVLAASALMPFADGTTALIPIPTHQFILWLFTSYAYVLVLPIVYVISLQLLWNSRSFGLVVLWASLLIALLDAAWLLANWEKGSSYPGVAFLHAVAAENTVGMSIAMILALIGVMRSSRTSTATAHLTIFLVLAWCGFPLLGRIDL